jgi:TetR/AcrR family transcriptional repressor of nem operon
MKTTTIGSESQHESKTKLLDAALHIIRAKGYSATRVEDICEAAGLTKGSFFHHFSSKEELALAAAEHFSKFANGAFAGAPYQTRSDPLDRLLGYVETRRHLLRGELPDCTCLLGTLVQETYDTHPLIREACETYFGAHAASLIPDIEAAIRKYGIQPTWTAESLANYMQAVIQGAFVLAKARKSKEVAASCLDHLHRYLKMLFLYSQGAKERL